MEYNESMANSFHKDVRDSMRDCILAIFWPKKDIISFFQDNGCTARDLKDVQDFKNPPLRRAEIVDKVFDKLLARDDDGLGQFRSMLQSLTEWSNFDPYYFDKLMKLDRSDAQRRITHLKQVQEIRDAKLKEKREARLAREREINRSHKTLDTLRDQFTNLYQGLDDQGKVISSRDRGYVFQSFLVELCRIEGLSVTEPFKIKGEQIDGAIKFEGENYIVEAKWQDTLTASNSLYHFAHKVEGKMYGRGIFISVNGYSSDSVSALLKGKAMRTILFDGGDLALVVEGLWSFTNIIDRKVKAAQTMGYIYVDVATMKNKQS